MEEYALVLRLRDTAAFHSKWKWGIRSKNSLSLKVTKYAALYILTTLCIYTSMD